MWAAGHWFHRTPRIQSPEPVTATNSPAAPAITIVRHANASIFRKPKDGIAIVYQIIFHLVLNLVGVEKPRSYSALFPLCLPGSFAFLCLHAAFKRLRSLRLA